METQAAESDEDAYKPSMDRISQLPQPILHHILSFLSQKEAVQTCVLSKSWRHLGSTRPNVEFSESCFSENKETLISALDKTLQRYLDQNLSVQEFLLDITGVDFTSISLLKKWITIVIQNMGLKTFRLSSSWTYSEKLDLLSIVFESESLQELYLKRCRLNEVHSMDNVISLKHLQTLSLTRVRIAQETLETIFSSCPSLEHVSIILCLGFKALKVNKPHGLKYFTIDDYYSLHKIEEEPIHIEFDIPTLENITITRCWFHHHNYFLPHLTRLFLSRVQLSVESFEFFSGDYLPLLEHLTLDLCYGFEEFHMYLSGSVKYLSIRNLKDRLVTAAIVAPNIATFLYEGDVPQSAFSFTTNTREWKSNIILKSDECFDIDVVCPWFHMLNELLNALSQSKISLELSQCRSVRMSDELQLHTMEKVPLVVVESLSLTGYYTYFSFLDFLNCLFRVCHPRNIYRHLLSSDDDQSGNEDKKLYRYLLEFFLIKKEMRQCFWPDDLEEVSLQCFDENGQKRRPFFRLKWKE